MSGTVSINDNANSLDEDTYNSMVTFANTTNGVGGGKRGVTLTVTNGPGTPTIAHILELLLGRDDE